MFKIKQPHINSTHINEIKIRILRLAYVLRKKILSINIFKTNHQSEVETQDQPTF